MDFYDVLKLPFRDGRKFLSGILVGIFCFLTLGLGGILLAGFGYRVGENFLRNERTLPKWENLKELAIKGMMVYAVSIIYFIPAAVLFIYGIIPIAAKITGALVSNVSTVGLIPIIFNSESSAILLVASVLKLAALFVLPMGIIFMISGNNFKAAFKFKEIFAKVFTVHYIFSWVYIVLDLIILILIASVIGILPIFGTVIGVAILSYALTVSLFALAAESYNVAGGNKISFAKAAAKNEKWPKTNAETRDGGL